MLGKCSWEKWTREKCPPEKCPPGKFPGRIFFVSNFISKEFFFRNFFFSVHSNFFFFVFFYFFFCAYFFDFFKYDFWLDFWHIMFFMHRYVTINAGKCCLLIKVKVNWGETSLTLQASHNTLKLRWLPQHTIRTFYSTFEENRR